MLHRTFEPNDVVVFEGMTRGMVYGNVILNLDLRYHIEIDDDSDYDTLRDQGHNLVSHHRNALNSHPCYTAKWESIWNHLDVRSFKQVDSYFMRSTCQKFEAMTEPYSVGELLNNATWSKTEGAIDEFGEPVSPFSTDAALWTLQDALIKIYGATPGHPQYVKSLEFIRQYDPTYNGNTINGWELELDVDFDDIQYLIEETKI